MAKNPQIPINFSLVELFSSAFGKKPVFEPDIETLPARVENSSTGSSYYGIDQFGREVFLPITFEYTGENDLTKTVVLNHAVIEIELSNDAVKTQLTEQAGSFKEIVSGNDRVYTISGFLISKTNDFPEDLFKELLELDKYKIAVMKNAITDLTMINPDRSGGNLVFIEHISFPQVVGKKNVKPYIMRVVSDAPFNLTEID